MMHAAAKFNARERSGYEKSTADGLKVEESSLDPSTEAGQMDVLRIRGSRGSGRDREEASLVSLERKICLAVGWLTFLTVVLVVGLQWRSSEYPPGISDSKSLQREPGTKKDNDSERSTLPRDASLGGLIAGGVDRQSCRSRHEAVGYRHVSPHKPSFYLVEKLRNYEARHRKCGPGTSAYKEAVKHISEAGPNGPAVETECKYALWTPFLGLGNRLISLSSAFLYALLTDRVLLIDKGTDFAELFCEPIPGTSWVIPPDFPLKRFYYDRWDNVTYGSVIRDKKPLPSFIYAHVVLDSGIEDNRFYFEEDQKALRKVPWILLRSEVYFAPVFFLNRDFEPELRRMFPETDTVFHHLSRYLYHPSNLVWSILTRYYQTYLSAGMDNLGIQIRIYDHRSSPFSIVSEQIINCTIQEKLLPESDPSDPPEEPKKWKIKNVFLATLHYGYMTRIRTLYWEHPPAGKMLVSVHQPSQEENQRTDNENHDVKAWMEINLLSFSNVLVTSAWSTFGYSAQGLGGLTPWILVKPKDGVMPQPTCFREISMEPCSHLPPPYLVEMMMEGGKGKVAPYVAQCLDADGIKIFRWNP